MSGRRGHIRQGSGNAPAPGPCISLKEKDPAVFAARAAMLEKPHHPCTGNSIRVCRSMKECNPPEWRIISDTYLVALLEQAKEEGGRRARDLTRLSLLRVKLSEQGEASFDQMQVRELASLVSDVERPPPTRIELTPDEINERKTQIRGFYISLEGLESNNIERRNEGIRLLFGENEVKQRIDAIDAILSQYGYTRNMATVFVCACAAASVNWLKDNLSDGASKKNWAKLLFNQYLNPSSTTASTFWGASYIVPESIRRARSELQGGPKEELVLPLDEELRMCLAEIPVGQREAVKEVLVQIITTAGVCKIHEVRGGAPGSGQGGSSIH